MVDGKTARELNDTIRYTAWSVFRIVEPIGDYEARAPLSAEVEALFEQLAAKDVVGLPSGAVAESFNLSFASIGGTLSATAKSEGFVN